MNDEKPWYLSRTIWASLVTVMLALAGTFQLSVESADGEAAAELLVQLVTAVAGLTAILGRVQARDRIGRK